MDIKIIRVGLTKPGKTRTGLAAAMGVVPSAITALLNDKRELKAKEIPAVVRYLELNIVHVVGRVGAGASIEPDFEQVPEDGLYQVELPFELPADMVAFEVDGDSMLPRYSPGDVIVTFREQRRSIETFYGEEAAVRTRAGQRYLKTVLRGGKPKTVTLRSWNATDIENVHLEWIGEVYLTLRGHQVKRQHQTNDKKK